MTTEKLTTYLHNLWMTMESLSFWLLVGLGIAGVLHLWVPNNFIKKHLGHGGVSTVLKAVLLGVPMPLCSCGVIPAALGIKRQGAGNGAAIGFLISTPQTGVDSITVSASMLGLPFALFKVFSAFVTGWIGGFLVHVTDPAVDETVDMETNGNGAERPERTFKEWFAFAIDDILMTTWKWLVAGVLISAALDTWLPADFFQHYFPDNKFILMATMLLISIPLYVCATASVPFAAALIHAGMPVGAALVFLMAGPASNVATLGAVYRGFGLKNLLVYLGTIIVGSIGLGLAFDFVIPPSMAQNAVIAHSGHSMFATIAAVILVVLLFRFLALDLTCAWKKMTAAKVESCDVVELSVGGMTCQGCAGKVDKALREVDGVASVSVNLEDATVAISGSDLDQSALTKIVRGKGFSVSE